MQSSEVLQDLGLKEKEIKTYLALLELGSSTIKPIAVRAGIKRTSIYNFIEHLLALGLITRSTVRGRQNYQAAAPARLLELQKERLGKLELLLPYLQQAWESKPGKVRLSYFEGPKEVMNIVREEPRCRKEALYIWPGVESLSAVGGAKTMAEIDRQRIEKGVWVRTVRFRKKDMRYPRSANGPQYLRELRWAPPGIQVSMGLGIYDSGKVGFFSSRKENFGILIESAELAQLMRGLFSLLWAGSAPAGRGEG